MFLLKIDFNELIWNLDCPGFKQNLVKVKDVCHPLSSEMSDYDLDHWGNILDLSNEKLARIFVNTLEVIFIHSKTVFESSQYLNGSIPSILDLFLKYEPYRNPTKNSDFLHSHGPSHDQNEFVKSSYKKICTAPEPFSARDPYLWKSVFVTYKWRSIRVKLFPSEHLLSFFWPDWEWGLYDS